MITITHNNDILITQVGGNIFYSRTTLDPTPIQLTAADWPVTIANSNNPLQNITVFFNTNITLNALDQHFIVGSGFITFDGNTNTNTITISIDNWGGLIQNGIGNNAFTNIIVQNIN